MSKGPDQIREGLVQAIHWMIVGGYDHAAGSFALYLYPGEARPLARFTREYADRFPFLRPGPHRGGDG